MALFPEIWQNVSKTVRFVWKVIADTIYAVFHDSGVITIFFVAGLVYPVLYGFLCWENTVKEVPIIAVDLSGSKESMEFLRKVDASPDVKIEYRCTSMIEAEQLMKAQKAHGIIYFPRDYADRIKGLRGQAHVSLYCDMTTFLYMKNLLLPANMVMLEEMHQIQLKRMNALGLGDELAYEFTQGAPYEETKLYNPIDGYASFLIPPVLVLIILQTLFLGICMLRGTFYEERRTIYQANAHHFSHAILVTIGMALAFFIIYSGLSAIDLILFPRIFKNLPHIGDPMNILLFIVPLLLSTIFFSLFVSGFMHNRETGMVILLPTSLLFLFIAGVSWPQPCIPKAWRILSYFFPSTWGLHGYLHLNSMGASMLQIKKEFDALWILTGFYFVLTVVQQYLTFRKARKH